MSGWRSLKIGDRTRERYESNVRVYLRPASDGRRAQDITVDDVAKPIASLQADGKAGWTIRPGGRSTRGAFRIVEATAHNQHCANHRRVPLFVGRALDVVSTSESGSCRRT